MTKNSSIQELLQSKLGVKRAQIYAMAKKVSDSLSISTADAILLLAVKNGINLQKHGGALPEGKISQVRSLLPHLPQAPVPSVPSTSTQSKSRLVRGKNNALRTKVKLLKPEKDPILEQKVLDELKAMVPVYEILYHFENSMRVFIRRVLRAKYGPDWWELHSPQGLKDTVRKRTKDDAINAWHQKRSTDPINYLDLNQLPALVRATQADFIPTFFPSLEWYQQFIDELYRSRCVVSHMNPLIASNIDAIAVRFNQWQQLTSQKIEELKRLE
jgi:hypothetical protein